VMVLDVDHYESVTKEMDGERRERFDRLLLGIVRRGLPCADSWLAGQVRPGTLAIILSTDPNDADLRGLRSLAQSIRYAVESSVPVTATIGIGRRYAEFDLIPQSYSEAVRAQFYRPYFGGNCVIYIDDLPKTDQGADASYPVELERELIQSIQVGERQRAEEKLNTVLGYLLAQPGESLETVRTRLVELMALASRAVIQAGAPAAAVLSLSHEQTEALGRLKSIEDMRTWAVQSMSSLLAQVEPGDHGDKLVNTALQYMRENLSRSGLELKDVARAVNLSNSHLAHLLKSKNGTSYVKYLTQLRVEEAKKLLATTDSTIAAVSVAVGYEDATYFHRVFRRETSMTPSAYRQAQRSGKVLARAGS
jgi:two-component system, response regulator YesN